MMIIKKVKSFLAERRRCQAFKPQERGVEHFGQCDLQHMHEGRHALERGMEIIFWSTREFIVSPEVDSQMRGTLLRIVDSVTDYQPFKPIVVDELMRYFHTQARALLENDEK